MEPDLTSEAHVAARRKVVRDALAVGAATGAYGISFGAISVASGLTVLQTAALSVLLFSGGSQFALVGVLGAGGGAGAAVATAGFLGVRNAFYGVRLASLLRVRGVARPVAAQLVIDESTAMAVGQPTSQLGRLAFWSTGLAVFVLWNLMTVVGALAGSALASPETLGLDAAAPAAFLALLWPRLQGRHAWGIAALAVAVGLALTPLTPPGVPVLVVAAVVIALGWRTPAGAPAASFGGGP
ncbi:MAG: AzlC family ABC transporter permease [Actinomycetales bacterium]